MEELQGVMSRLEKSSCGIEVDEFVAQLAHLEIESWRTCADQRLERARAEKQEKAKEVIHSRQTLPVQLPALSAR